MKVFLATAAIALLTSAPSSATPEKGEKSERQPVKDTLIKVTTFTDLGATLRGAAVKLLPADNDGKPVKGKALQGVTNGMGEFPFHVPKTEGKYVLLVEAKGFDATSKLVSVHGEDQQDVFLQLPAKK